MSVSPPAVVDEEENNKKVAWDVESSDGETAKEDDTSSGLLPVPKKKLFYWNLVMGIFHSTFGIVTVAVGNRDLKVPIYGGGVTLLTDLGGNETRSWVLIPAPKRNGWLYLTYLTASFFFLSAVAHLGNAILWRPCYERALANAYAPFRWLEYFFSASVMITILAYTSGTLSSFVHIALFGLTSITMVFGHLHEVICRPESPSKWAISNPFWRLQAHLFGYIPQIVAWFLVVWQFMLAGGETSTDETGEERRMPDFVYGIVFGELLMFWSFGVVQLIVSLRSPSKYYQGEIAYQVLSLVAKGLLGILVLSNVLILGDFADIYEQAGSAPPANN